MKIAEIFHGISGEQGLFRQGEFVTFIRLAGCNLRCSYCDTRKTQTTETATEMTPEQVAAEACQIHQDNRFLITGGEPLIQYLALEMLVSELRDHTLPRPAYVQVETNGSYIPSLPLVKTVDCWVVDYKLPSSGMMEKMLPLEAYKEFSFQGGPARPVWIKFVIADSEDYGIAKRVRELLLLEKGAIYHFAFGAVSPSLDPARLAAWMEKDRLALLPHVYLNTQIHKMIGVA